MFSMTPYIRKLCVLSVSQIPELWDYRYLSVSSVCLMLNYIFVYVNDIYLLISLSAVWASASMQQCGHEIGGTLCRSILLPRGPQGLNSGLQKGRKRAGSTFPGQVTFPVLHSLKCPQETTETDSCSSPFSSFSPNSLPVAFLLPQRLWCYHRCVSPCLVVSLHF